MKRYERTEMTDDEKIDLLTNGGLITEVSGSVIRILVVDGRLFEIQTAFWNELKEAE